MRIRFLIPLAVVGLAACSSSPAASDVPASENQSADALVVTVSDFMIDPSELEVAGPTVTIDVTSDGPTPHTLTVRDAIGSVLMGTEELSAGDTATISGEVDAGEYTIFCALPGHESLGMSGTLTVTAP